MPQSPTAIGMMICDKVIYDAKTKKPYLLGVFTAMPIEDFDSPQRFDIFATLTDGQGEIVMTLRVFHLNDSLEEDEEVYAQKVLVVFPHPLQEVSFVFGVRQIRFPKPGTYLFALMSGETEIAARRIRVYQRNNPHE